ncbi:RagB/SusD family nutrient uptake outer membrane protein [Flavivirga abyssicola]|uniref:RagB/SusD family nutrient uptake outer membrane protein n=1 Tax=Flavivirga abyssicola TaxID=3063533 RepID=UPI0026DEA44C|nr:RagB/SusD family nutrient uptake outer membrane protein [Flavivirga sp. MEBiC07777]WVK13704.1 RagB/SusD family nutrient uptake outer membrane protein [Flavivirga sp. MEBiC07777]
MKNILNFFFSLCILLVVSSCTDDLNTEPKVELSLDELLAQDPNAVEGIVSRLYASFALSGVQGPDKSDISDNAGESPFLRGIINLQDFTADGMKNRWGDDGLDQLTTTSDWDENNKFFRYLFNRVYFTIPQCNNLLAVANNISIENKESVIAEVRFLRALAYYYLIDTFGKGVLATEENFGDSAPLPEASRAELFAFVEAELIEVEANLPATNSYGRASKAAGQMLLAKLYMNAEVYVGTSRYDDALVLINKVIDEGGFSLAPNFVSLFSADNDTSPEIIFPLIADADTSQSFGNTTYIVNGSLSTETMVLADFGANDGWTGHRATKAWYGLYGDLGTSTDDRASLFWTTGHNFEMADYREWTDGYPSVKFRNTNFNGASTVTAFSGTDFPLFRLADTYLMYAECTLRGASGGAMNTALQYVNAVRSRSNASTITQSELTLDFLIDERGRELNLEGHRRSDLIRFGMFTGNSYIWPWKGNVAGGTSIPDSYRLFPIPLAAMQANPNLTQNPGF